ncbi:hypothetical protein [Flavobacterium silvaticum]|uniref:Uncharacterized protein n=1 Tax=Flavobacterium silvaticum TaxID=1852020 RepID=A0A972FJ82_9FLAO|nr:hypothetical protein [Flavobacterium silvaticum]NMH27039.1 hypothetical protein [Flavobacterium silvaticum]
MKKILLLLTLICNSIFANPIFEYKLGKHEKLQGTFTAELGNGKTLHLISIKNTDTKEFLLIPFLVDADKSVHKMNPGVSKELFAILSYHNNGNVTTLVSYSEKSNQLQIIDFDMVSGQNTITLTPEAYRPDNIFRLDDKTVLVHFLDKSKKVETRTIFSGSNQISGSIEIPKEQQKAFKELVAEVPQTVNQNEFVKNGSISKRKGYLQDNHLIYTFEKDEDDFGLYDFDLASTSGFTQTKINPEFSKETKEISNYVFGKKMLFLGVEKQDVKLKSFDLASGKSEGNLSFASDLNASVNSELLTEYIKNALKSAMKPTLTVNKTKSGNLALRADSVDSRNYSYNYNWWYIHWHMQQMMMMQQQQQLQLLQMQRQQQMMTRGPAQQDSDFFLLPEKSKEVKAIEFTISPDFKLATGEDELQFRNLDQGKYMEKYKTTKIEEASSGFTSNEIRVIYQDYKSKTVFIEVDML